MIVATKKDKHGKIHKSKKMQEGNCQFPFKYNRKLHTECIKGKNGDWCATKIDSDKKKIHLVLEMINFTTKKQVAVCETLLINVDLNIRKSVNYQTDVIKRIELYQDKCSEIKLPLQVGKNLKIIKK